MMGPLSDMNKMKEGKKEQIFSKVSCHWKVEKDEGGKSDLTIKQLLELLRKKFMQSDSKKYPSLDS